MKNGKSTNNDKKFAGEANKSADNSNNNAPNGTKSVDENQSADKKRITRYIALLALLIIILLLLLYFGRFSEFFKHRVRVVDTVADTASIDTSRSDDTAGAVIDTATIDTVSSNPSKIRLGAPVKGDGTVVDSATLKRALADSLLLEDSTTRDGDTAYYIATTDSMARVDSLWREDSTARALLVRDSLAAAAMDACARDTLAPYVYADPSGGLHRAAIFVKLIANKKCAIEWSLDGSKTWKVYDGNPINISKATTLSYRAQDDCGKKMVARSKRYEFDFTNSASKCPQGMEHIKVGDKEFCTDIYEWPNRKGGAPYPFVSLYQAMDSCFSVRKRLCTSDEWTAACAGPSNWKYPYGNSYENNACVTGDTTAHLSGSKPECRGYFAVFDMAGNLGEWTSTQSPHNSSFNNVMGGFWASGTQSRCADARYSYFPQNKHNPVGFRCCKDAGPSRDEPSKSKGNGRN